MLMLMLASLAVAALTVLLCAALLVRRARVRAWEREAEEARIRVEPVALALVDGDPPEPVAAADEPALAQALSRLAPMLVGETRESIGAFFEERGAVERAAEGLGSIHGHVRAQHAALLGDMCSGRAELPLLQALNDRDADVRLAASRSLGRLRSRKAGAPLLHALAHGSVPRAVATGALLAIGASCLPTIRELLEHPEAHIRTDAVELLGLLGNPADSERLQLRLVDPVATVRGRACEALGRLGADDAKPSVEQALLDGELGVRLSAARALAQVGDSTSASFLIRIAQEDVPEAAEVAVRTLVEIAPRITIEAGSHPDAGPHLRQAADAIRAAV